MQITKKRLKEIIQEEVNRAESVANNKQAKINELVSLIKSLDEVQLTELHENLKRDK